MTSLTRPHAGPDQPSDESTHPVGTAVPSANPVSGLLRATRAELLRMRRWPALWVTVSAWLVLTALFGYVFNYVSYTSGESSFTSEGQPRAALLAEVLPENLGAVLIQGTPMFGGALLMVLGALVAGSGYGWGTWKTAFIHGPSRTVTTLGSLVALTGVVVATVLATLALCVAFSVGIGLAEGQSLVWPAMSDLLLDLVTAFGILLMWAFAGFFLGVVARGPALSVGLGLVWALVVENLLRSVGSMLAVIESFTTVLPGTAAGSLVGSLTNVSGGGDGTPGVLDLISGTQAAWTVVAWIVLLPVVSIILVRRRDVA